MAVDHQQWRRAALPELALLPPVFPPGAHSTVGCEQCMTQSHHDSASLSLILTLSQPHCLSASLRLTSSFCLRAGFCSSSYLSVTSIASAPAAPHNQRPRACTQSEAHSHARFICTHSGFEQLLFASLCCCSAALCAFAAFAAPDLLLWAVLASVPLALHVFRRFMAPPTVFQEAAWNASVACIQP